jgi:hypothetical protein
VATWDDVGRIALDLPGTVVSEAHEGSPAYDVQKRQFARLRWDDTGREILQFWTEDREALVHGRPDAYWVTKAFPAAVFGWLDSIAPDELREIITDSWRARAPKRLLESLPEAE